MSIRIDGKDYPCAPEVVELIDHLRSELEARPTQQSYQAEVDEHENWKRRYYEISELEGALRSKLAIATDEAAKLDGLSDAQDKTITALGEAVEALRAQTVGLRWWHAHGQALRNAIAETMPSDHMPDDNSLLAWPAKLLERAESAERKLSTLPADWSKDSSLETWFPFTAEQLKALKSEHERSNEIQAAFMVLAQAVGNPTLEAGPESSLEMELVKYVIRFLDVPREARPKGAQ